MRNYVNVNLEDIQLNHNTFGFPYSVGSSFMISESGNVVARSVESYNNVGPLLRCTNVLNQTIQNLNLTDVYSSANSTKWSYRYLIYLSRSGDSSTAYNQWASQSDQSTILMENIMINVRNNLRF